MQKLEDMNQEEAARTNMVMWQEYRANDEFPVISKVPIGHVRAVTMKTLWIL